MCFQAEDLEQQGSPVCSICKYIMKKVKRSISSKATPVSIMITVAVFNCMSLSQQLLLMTSFPSGWNQKQAEQHLWESRATEI